MKFFNKENKLYPPIEPYDSGYISKESMKFIMSNAGIPKVNLQYSFMVGLVEVLEVFLEDFLILRNIA